MGGTSIQSRWNSAATASEDNLYAGLSYEISNSAIISKNIFKGNGAKTFGWGWYGQVQIQNSWGVQVYNNKLVLDGQRGGNGIVIIQQNRGHDHLPKGNSIHHNDITMAGGDGVVAGWFADFEPNKFAGSNRFDKNHYHVYAPDGAFWSANALSSFGRLAGDRTGHQQYRRQQCVRHTLERFQFGLHRHGRA